MFASFFLFMAIAASLHTKFSIEYYDSLEAPTLKSLNTDWIIKNLKDSVQIVLKSMPLFKMNN